jgi:hypothetical protein
MDSRKGQTATAAPAEPGRGSSHVMLANSSTLSETRTVERAVRNVFWRSCCGLPMIMMLLDMQKGRLVFLTFFVFGALTAATSANVVFQTQASRLVIGTGGTARVEVDDSTHNEHMTSEEVAFTVMNKVGGTFPASSAERRGDLIHFSFGASGASADYRITAAHNYFIVELVGFSGNVKELLLAQIRAPFRHSGSILGVQWDEHFAICLMGLSAQINVRTVGALLQAVVRPEIPIAERRVAVIATATQDFLKTVQSVETDFHLPSPSINGTWAKRSREVRNSYLFIDLDEANVDEVIRYAKLGGLRYILIHSDTWASTLGSYGINAAHFPRGEAGLKAVIDKCHAAGLKVGMRMLTSAIGHGDPLVQPVPDYRLLSDASTMLTADADATSNELMVAAGSDFGDDGSIQGHEAELSIDDEIVHCSLIAGSRLSHCTRGYAGTNRAPHRAGTVVRRVVSVYGTYLADLKTSLGTEIAERVAGLINRCGFDMVYYDGAEANAAQGNSWYWVGRQQNLIWEKTTRDLIQQSSALTHWLWHILSRGTCDDLSVICVKQYLDQHKIADLWQLYRDNFLPAELGWWGVLASNPAYPATTPDEAEYYAVRALALDSPLSIQTRVQELRTNKRTEEILSVVRQYEELRLRHAVPETIRAKLESDEWHMPRVGEFHRVRRDVKRLYPGETIRLNNLYSDQPLKFRLQALPGVNSVGDPTNLQLLSSERRAAFIPQPGSAAAMPGALVMRRELGGRSLLEHRTLAVELEVELPGETRTPPPVLNVQLEDAGGLFRDHYIDLTFSGHKTIVLTEPQRDRVLTDCRPASANYSFKMALSIFDYGHVNALNLRWMRYPPLGGVRCRVVAVVALAERSAALKNVRILTEDGSESIIRRELRTGDYVESDEHGQIRAFDRNGTALESVNGARQTIHKGNNLLTFRGDGPGELEFTAITMDSNPLR